MLKRLTVAVAALFALAAQAFAAGTIQYSLSQQLDEFGKPLAGCKLYLIQAGTTSTPQNGYQDSALTLTLPNPLTCDAAGRLPQFFLADGSIKVRLTKSNGVNVVTADGILVIGASSGGGGGSPVDATTVLTTGDIKIRYGTGILSGFVRMNGRTIGNASSGATERANADTEALFGYLWGLTTLPVSGGRGVSASADFAANKNIALPDARGRGLVAMDDLGTSAAGILTTASCATPTTIGASCGTETKTITQGNLPAYTVPNTLGISNTMGVSDTRVWRTDTAVLVAGAAAAPAAGGIAAASTGKVNSETFSGSLGLTGSVSLTGSITSGGSGTAISSLNPIMLITVYFKL